MTPAAAIAFPSLVEAISFFTYPLSLAIPKSTVKSIQQYLLSALSTTPAWLRNGRLTLTFAPAAPPHVVFAACAANHVEWSDWFYVLGGREFDLIIERNVVLVQVTGIPGRVVIWKQVPIIHPPFVSPVAPLGPAPTTHTSITQSDQPKAPPVIPANRTRSPALQTVAQQLLRSEHEKEEADEIFAMISNLNACVVSSAPTCEQFNSPRAPVPWAPVPTRLTCLSALAEEALNSIPSSHQSDRGRGRDTPSDSSPDSSRSSSPSSSVLSYSSSQESLTSISTTYSITQSSPIKSFAKPPVLISERAPVRHRESVIAPAIADSSKNQIQRYLYQGGQSTTLTGGVMLGTAPKTYSRAKKIRNPTTRNQPPYRPGSNPASWMHGVPWS